MARSLRCCKHESERWRVPIWTDTLPGDFEGIEAAGKVSASFEGGQDGFFFDPLNRLDNGEHGVAFVSHEGGGWEPNHDVKALDYGQILLRMVADKVASWAD